MSKYVTNHVPGMISLSGKTVNKFGKDTTGLIKYRFNQQGFRSFDDYNTPPDYAFFGCSLVFGVGVDVDYIFANKFKNKHNYGLAGNYNNHDVMIVLEKFLESDFYSPQTKIAVVWHSRDSDCLEQFYHRLYQSNIVHFYCGIPLPFSRCFAFPRQLDRDASGTHPGPRTHLIFSKMLCATFDQL